MKPIYFIIFFVALLIGYFIDDWKLSTNDLKKPSKKYPIEVVVYYSEGSYGYSNTMDADSVRNDTIWNNGIYITNKNIKNIVFK